MKIELLQRNYWDGFLNADNAAAIQAEIIRRITGKISTLVIDNPSVSDLEIYTWQTYIDSPAAPEGAIRFDFNERRFTFENPEGEQWYIVLRGDEIRFRRDNFGKNGEAYRVYFRLYNPEDLQ